MRFDKNLQLFLLLEKDILLKNLVKTLQCDYDILVLRLLYDIEGNLGLEQSKIIN